MHQITVAGRATKDSEEFESKNKKKFTKLSVAVNEYGSEKKGTEDKVYYYEVLVFGKSAEKAKELVKKGDSVFVQGKPELNIYTSKKNNETKAQINIFADTWTVVK